MANEPEHNDKPKGWGDWLENVFNEFADPDGEKHVPTEDEIKIRDFFRLIDSGKTEQVRKTLEAEPQLARSINKDGLSPLHMAARCNMVAIMEILLRAGANPQALQLGKDEDVTPLSIAIRYGRKEATVFLAQNGGYSRDADENGWTLMHHLCAKGKTDAVKTLIEAGIPANQITEGGSSTLMVALLKDQFALADMLLDHEDVQSGLNAHFASADPAARTAFHFAIEKGQTALVRKMIALGAHVNGVNGIGETPLICAIDAENADIVHLLSRKGADVGTTGKHAPLSYLFETAAFDSRMEKIMTVLINDGADMGAVHPVSGQTALHLLAAREDGGRHLNLALTHPGIDLEHKDANGETALHIAVAKGNLAIAERLLARGLDVNARNAKTGETPLMLAAQDINDAMTRLLLKWHANPALADNAGKTALTHAQEGGHANTVEALTEALARQNKTQKKPQDKQGPGATVP